MGKDFWATATSSEWGPEFPLLHSRDLVNWTLVGAVFPRRPAWSVGNYWAPEISQYHGRYFIYYTARKKDGPLCVAVATSIRPQGPYRDMGPLICQEVGSIDAFPVTDENGKRYLLWKEDGNSAAKPTPIWAQQLSGDGTRLVGERSELLRNTAPWEAQLVEGPAVVSRNGWFYLFYSGNACCGRECNYALGVARSRKLLGSWEKNPANPILAANDSWKCPGHGTVVDDGRGRFYLMYHAYDPHSFVYVGRQALLNQVVWNEEGWPVINGGNGPSVNAASPFGAMERNSEYSFFDQFTAPRLQPGWQWPQAKEPVVRIDVARGGWLVLQPEAKNAADQIGAVLARSTTAANYVATTVLDTRSLKGGALAGLAAYGDSENALGASIGDGQVVLWQREKNNHRTVTTAAAPLSPLLYLQMTTRDGHLFQFSISEDGRKWTNVGEELEGGFLPPWDRGVRVALVAGGLTNATARFDWLRITGRP